MSPRIAFRACRSATITACVRTPTRRKIGSRGLEHPAVRGGGRVVILLRFSENAGDDIALNQALLAYASDYSLLGTAMRPHEGVGQSMAHVSISTTVAPGRARGVK